jgi:anti-sigma-K factor RskA
MNCDELREHYDLYALSIAEEPERGEIRAHLNRGCEVCMAGVKRSLETVALIGTTAAPAEPSAQLRRRILASIGSADALPQERRSWWLPAWAAALAMAALLASAASLAITSRRHAEEAASLRVQLGTQTDQIARLTEAFAIVEGPRTIEASFGGVQPRPPQGKVFVNPARGVLLIASNLPRTPADKIYEMWIIRKSAKPVPAGLFQSQADGSALHVRPGTVDVASAAAIAVTVENEAGAEQPTSTPLIVAPLPEAARQ